MGRTDLRPDITKEVLEEYIRKGYSQNRIAITLGTTQSTIFNKLKKYGLQVQKTRPSNYDEKALIKQLQNGWTTEQIARYFGSLAPALLGAGSVRTSLESIEKHHQRNLIPNCAVPVYTVHGKRQTRKDAIIYP